MVDPTATTALVDALDTLLGGETPLAVLWQGARDGARAALAQLELAPDAGAAPWGIDRGGRFEISARAVRGADAAAAAEALRGLLTGDRPPPEGLDLQAAVDAALADVPVAVWHARVAFPTAQPEVVLGALARVAARIGLEAHTVGAAPPGWAESVALPHDALWVGRDPETGHVALLRADGHRASLDVVVAATPAVRPSGLVQLAAATGRAEVLESSAALTARLSPNGLDDLEAGLAGHAALAAAMRLEGEGRTFLLAMSLRTLGDCRGRWRAVAAATDAITIQLDAADRLPQIRAHVALTEEALRRWMAATGRSVLISGGGAPTTPAGYEITLRRVPFVRDGPLREAPRSFAGWTSAFEECRAGHPATAIPAALAVLPAVLPAAELPVPLPAIGSLGGEDPEAAAALLLGYEARAEGPVPHIGAAALSGIADLPRDADPLGVDAEVAITPEGPRWIRRGDGLTVGFARRSAREDEALSLFALGEGALAALERRIAHADEVAGREPSARFGHAWVDARALLGAQAEVGPPGQVSRVLEPLVERVWGLRIEGWLDADGRAVRYDARLVPRSEPSEPAAAR